MCDPFQRLCIDNDQDLTETVTFGGPLGYKILFGHILAAILLQHALYRQLFSIILAEDHEPAVLIFTKIQKNAFISLSESY